jgi:hypothetical protein
MYIMPTSTASDATRESAPSDFSHSLLDICSVGYTGFRDDGAKPPASKIDCTNSVLALL